jgi:polygalacturonase
MKNRLLLFILFITALSFAACNYQRSSFNIRNYGAKGDGKTINTKAINRAIKKCNSLGGGTVLIPPGKFVTGTVVLLSNVNFHLEPGAILIGSRDTSDYLKMETTLFDEGYNRFGMICAVDAVNISITGSGEINGNGTCFMNGLDKPKYSEGDYERKFTRQGEEFMKSGTFIPDGPVSYPFRPGLMITIERCENVNISDVVLKDSPEWTIRLGDCDNALVRGISILNNKLIPNNDGIHVTTSRNVRISDCNIFAGDDAIIVTGFGNSPLPGDLLSNVSKPLDIGNKTGIAENITVTNCVLSSRSACIRVGYGIHPVRNLVFSNLVMYESNRGIGIFARDNSRIENVLFSNIVIGNRLHSGHWWGKGEPIHISAIKDSKNGTPGSINNIRFSDITATSEAGILIYGTENSIIENISLENINLTINNGKYTESYGGNFDLRPAFPLEEALFKHDIPGVYAQFVRHLSISGFELNWGTTLPSFFTEGLEINHFSDLLLEGICADPAPPSKGISTIKLKDGVNVIVRNCSTKDVTALLNKERVK